jgi:hypothetical protein
MPDMSWLPNPPDGTEICLGFDGSDVDDWTAIRAETFEGFQFTPRFLGTGRRSGTRPSTTTTASPDEVHAAVEEMFERFRVDPVLLRPADVGHRGRELGAEVRRATA